MVAVELLLHGPCLLNRDSRTLPQHPWRGPTLLSTRRPDTRVFKRTIVVAIAFLLGSCSLIPPDRVESRPNIILIVADDLGIEAIGAYGSLSYDTPAIDALAAAGMRFNHAYASPLGSMTRVQLLTGRYTNRSYIAWGVLPPTEESLAWALKDAGYATLAVGKWQLAGHDLLSSATQSEREAPGQTPTDAGFDDYLVWNQHDIDGAVNRYADPFLWLPNQSTGAPLSRTLKGRYGPDFFADKVLNFISAQSRWHREQPFFIYYPMVLPHAPFLPPPTSDAWWTARHEADGKNFAAMVGHMDNLVGRIVGHLKRLNIDDETLVLFTADNGSSADVISRMVDGTHIRGGKGSPMETGTRVPLVAAWPGRIAQSKVTDALVDSTDFLPTFAEFGAARVRHNQVIDGKSFATTLEGGHVLDHPRQWTFTDYRPQRSDLPSGIETTRYAHDQRYKLYADGRFFDVAFDRTEAVDIIDKEEKTPKAIDALAKLHCVLDAMATVPDPVTSRVPPPGYVEAADGGSVQ
jgi:arylsulfatase A